MPNSYGDDGGRMPRREWQPLTRAEEKARKEQKRQDAIADKKRKRDQLIRELDSKVANGLLTSEQRAKTIQEFDSLPT